MVSGVSGLNYQNNFGNSCLPSYYDWQNYSVFGNYPNSKINGAASQQKQEVGFWEGTKAFFKGLLKPIKNMIKHPIKTALFMAGSAALIVGTGGAALPFMIGAGVAIGGYQVAKGAVNAITSDNRVETLMALEDMGEGTFTLGASVAGARAYAASSAAGSATASAAGKTTFGAKAIAYSKGLAQDTWTTLQAVPGSVKTSANMIFSGKFTGNLHSASVSAKLATEHRKLAKMRVNHDPNYSAATSAYNGKIEAYYTKFPKGDWARIASTRALKSGLLNATNEELIMLGLNSRFRIDPEVVEMANTYAPYM